MGDSIYVMVIEDSATQALRLQLIFEQNQFQVRCFSSAEAALEGIGKTPPDLIVVDYHLPGMRGDEFARQIRLNVHTRNIPIILLTEAGTEAIERQGFDSGIDVFINKAVDTDVLLLRMQALLKKSRRVAATLGSDALFRRAHLLIVDDSPTYLEYLKSHLEQEGYSVTPAAGGQEAISASENETFDCVVVDLIMPGINGFDLCEQLDSLRHERDLWFPIIILTGQESKGDMMRGFEVGADDFVSKSSDIAMLKARIRALLRRKFLHEENQRMMVEFRDKELQLAHAQSAKEVAEARAALMNELERSYGELESTNGKLRETQAQLVHAAKMASLGELVAGIAHEINNPLAYVIANQSTVDKMLREIGETVTLTGPPSAKLLKARDRLAGMLTGLHRIKDIVLNLRTFSRLDEGEMKRIDVIESVNSVVMLLEPRTKDRVSIDINYGEDKSLFCSPAVFNQVVMNIIANSIDSIVGRGDISIKIWKSEDTFYISIADTGTGIPPDIRDRIFEPFFTTKPVGLGTGLGLAISYSIVRAHHGEIGVESEMGKGTVFTVKIPLDLEARGLHEQDADRRPVTQ